MSDIFSKKSVRFLIYFIFIVSIALLSYYLSNTFFSTKVNEQYEFQYTQGLTGQIVNGSKLPNLPIECSSQYFLVDKDAVFWLVPKYVDRSLWPGLFSDHENNFVEVEGGKNAEYSPCMNGVSAECGCDSYFVVSKIKPLKN